VRRLALCSGKIYVDLVISENAARNTSTGVARVEQLAPFPLAEVRDLLARYPALEEVLWVQEEPENMGAWQFARPYLLEALANRVPLRLVSRPRSASPAEGSNNIHTFNQRKLIEEVFSSQFTVDGRREVHSSQLTVDSEEGSQDVDHSKPGENNHAEENKSQTSGNSKRPKRKPRSSS
jgi:hypothetical protein